MNPDRLTRHFIILRALRWLPIGVVLPFMIITPDARGLSIGAIGAVFAVHSAVAMALEVPSGALADAIGRRRVMLVGAVLTTVSLLVFAVAQGVATFMLSVALLAAGRALISGSLEAWYVDSLRLLDPLAPLARGLSRGTAAEGVAMASGALLGGALVAVSGPVEAGAGALSGYGIAAVGGALLALVYVGAVAVLVKEGPAPDFGRDQRASIGHRTREILATARAEAAASVTVRVVFTTGVAFGACITAIELLWQPRLGALLGEDQTEGFAFGALAAASMLAVAVGAGASPSVARRLGSRAGYLAAIAVTAVFIAILGIPETPLGFALFYLLAYLGLGIAEPMHFELLNEAVGAKARATLISAESLATQGGALIANLCVGALAAAHGSAAAWVVAGIVLALTAAAVAGPLTRVAPARPAHTRR